MHSEWAKQSRFVTDGSTLLNRHSTDTQPMRCRWNKCLPIDIVSRLNPIFPLVGCCYSTAIFFMFSLCRSAPIVWIVSRCHTLSRREIYAKELHQHIPVDIFGKCGKDAPAKQGPPLNLDFRSKLGKRAAGSKLIY